MESKYFFDNSPQGRSFSGYFHHSLCPALREWWFIISPTTRNLSMLKKSFLRLSLFCVMLFLVSGCVSGQKTSTGQEPAVAEQQPQVEKLSRTYSVLLVAPFTTAPEYGKDYPDAAETMQKSMIEALAASGGFTRVAMLPEAAALRDQALIIRANITKMRIVSGSARFWGGAFAGSSGMEYDLTLVDGKTDRVLRTKKMSSWNNSWAAAWNFGASDRSLPDDMGKITAGYIIGIMPGDGGK
jgi:hypothetical protein